MRGISLPVMSQPHKFVASLAPTLEAGQLTRQQGYLNLDWLDHMWWSDDVDYSIIGREREINWDWDKPRERETEWEGEERRRRESENFGSWRYAVWRHVQFNYELCTEYLHAPQVFTHYTYHYTHYYTSIHYLSQPLPKYRPAIILHRSSDNIFNLCTTVFHPRPR